MRRPDQVPLQRRVDRGAAVVRACVERSCRGPGAEDRPIRRVIEIDAESGMLKCPVAEGGDELEGPAGSVCRDGVGSCAVQGETAVRDGGGPACAPGTAQPSGGQGRARELCSDGRGKGHLAIAGLRDVRVGVECARAEVTRGGVDEDT